MGSRGAHVTPARAGSPETGGEPKPKRNAAKDKPPAAWRRTAAGSYRSADDRFEIQSEGSGRWFVVDEQEHDELGLARTLGPYPTLDAAKEAAEAQRGREAEASPLASRIARAAEHERSPRQPKGHPEPQPKPERTRATEPAKQPTPPRPRTWLEQLAERNAAEASRARAMITALVAEGLPSSNADAVVRRQIVDDQPAIAGVRLSRAVAKVIDDATSPARVARIARTLPAAADPLTGAADLARAVAREIVSGIADALGAEGGHHAVLPGWALVEVPAGRATGDGDGATRDGDGSARRIRLAPADEPSEPAE